MVFSEVVNSNIHNSLVVNVLQRWSGGVCGEAKQESAYLFHLFSLANPRNITFIYINLQKVNTEK